MSRLPERSRVLGVVFLIAGSAFAGDALESKYVTRLGERVLQYKDDVLQLVVGYRYAANSLDQKWILLDTYLTPVWNRPLAFQREDFSLVTPDGTRLNLPTQKRFAEGVSDVQRIERLAAIQSDPLEGYFPFRRTSEQIRFFVGPDGGIVRPELIVSTLQMAYGPLYFASPKEKWEPGIYTLAVKNKDVDLKLPLPLGVEGPLERVK
jgi:hypothetical protein